MEWFEPSKSPSVQKLARIAKHNCNGMNVLMMVNADRKCAAILAIDRERLGGINGYMSLQLHTSNRAASVKQTLPKCFFGDDDFAQRPAFLQPQFTVCRIFRKSRWNFESITAVTDNSLIIRSIYTNEPFLCLTASFDFKMFLTVQGSKVAQVAWASPYFSKRYGSLSVSFRKNCIAARPDTFTKRHPEDDDSKDETTILNPLENIPVTYSLTVRFLPRMRKIEVTCIHWR